MSSTAVAGTQVETAHEELNELILSGQALEGLERFYSEDVQMQENLEAPTVGKDANRKREREFFGSVEAVNEVSLRGSAVAGDLSFSEWTLDLRLKGGQPVVLNQVSVRRWKDGKVVHERFYYKA